MNALFTIENFGFFTGFYYFVFLFMMAGIIFPSEKALLEIISTVSTQQGCCCDVEVTSLIQQFMVMIFSLGVHDQALLSVMIEDLCSSDFSFFFLE